MKREVSHKIRVLLAVIGGSIALWWGLQAVSATLAEFFFLRELRTNPDIITASAIQRELEQKLQAAYPLRKSTAETLELQAQSILAFYIKEDGRTKVLFQKDSDTPLPIASITKLMTALVAMKHYPADHLITVTPEILETEGEAGQLRTGDVFPVKDLLYLALMESSNDAAVALAEPLGKEQFIALMNEEAALLNLQNTSFKNPTGLDEPKQNNLSTAQDLAKLTRYLFDRYPQVFDILSQSELALTTPGGMFHHTMKNTNELLGYYDWPTKTLGGKTGRTPQAGETLLLAVENPVGAASSAGRGGYIINVILGSEARFLQMRELLQWILQSYDWEKLPKRSSGRPWAVADGAEAAFPSHS